MLYFKLWMKVTPESRKEGTESEQTQHRVENIIWKKRMGLYNKTSFVWKQRTANQVWYIQQNYLIKLMGQ